MFRGCLGVVGVDDAAVAAAGVVPAATFLIELLKEIPDLLQDDSSVSGFGNTPEGKPNPDLLKKIVAILKTLFTKKDNGGGGSTKKQDIGGDTAPEEAAYAENGEGQGRGTELAMRTTPIYDTDGDGKDDESGLPYQDDGTGYDVTTKRQIIRKKKNFFVENPVITAGIVLTLIGGAAAIYHFVIAPKKAEKEADLKGIPPKGFPKKLPHKTSKPKQAQGAHQLKRIALLQ